MIEIRSLGTQAEFRDAVRLQQEIWGFADIELLPVRLFVVAKKVGGQAFGAYDGTIMVAFCLAIPGLKPGGGYYLHSHMLGVSPAYRDAGIGRRLKLAQRDESLARGIKLMEWTFDPLELKNAHFNIERLGAIVRRFLPNQYGTTTSRLHGGLPTDRLVAEWWLSSPRAQAVIEGRAFERPEVLHRIAVPKNIGELRSHHPKQARAVQASIGERFDECFRQGLAVIAFERTEDSGVYCIGKWELS
jgi:predicted GNAT superfamily acetyltransferase